MPLKKGTPLSPALAERLRTTLDAIGAHGSAAARHARGRLQEDLDPPGFAAFAALVASAGPAARKPATPPAPVPVLVRPAAHPRVADARAKLADAQAEAARRQDAASAAADAERRARTAADLAKSRRIESERALKSAAAEEEAATSALRARQAESKAAAQAAAVAERALEKAKAALGELTSSPYREYPSLTLLRGRPRRRDAVHVARCWNLHGRGGWSRRGASVCLRELIAIAVLGFMTFVAAPCARRVVLVVPQRDLIARAVSIPGSCTNERATLQDIS